VVESSKPHVVPFNIFKDLKYHHVKVGSDKTTFQTSIASLGKFIKKSNLLSIKNEHKMLAQEYVNSYYHLV
jgi:hypothetical protein